VLRFCAPAVLLLIGWHLLRRERREATAWLAVGLAAAILPELVKALVARPRPTLWPALIPASGYAFPSGHAVAGAALYPLLGWLRPPLQRPGRLGYGLGLGVGVFVGLSASMPGSTGRPTCSPGGSSAPR